MFDSGLSQLTDRELITELNRRFRAVVFAGIGPVVGEPNDTMRFVAGLKSDCVFLAASLQQHALNADIE